MTQADRTIEDVLKEHTPRLMAIEGVVGAAIGSHDGRPCILVTVAEETAAVREQVPDSLGGYPVRILATGAPSLLDLPPESSGE